MRTDDEIIARIEEVKDRDWLGTQRSDLISVLPFNRAKPFLKDGANEAEWSQRERDEETVKAGMLSYMPFAWDKANGCRGLSAGRSLDHMSAWLWLLGETAAADDILEYTHYGKPQLRAICEAFGWDWRQWDGGSWRNSESGPSSGAPISVAPLRMMATS